VDFLIEALIFLVTALIAVTLGKRLGLSSVLGYLTAGLIIGPHGLNVVGDAAPLLHFAEIGVVMLLFIIGLELQPRRLWVMRRLVFGLGTAQMLVTSIATGGVIYVVFALDWRASALLGFAVALSSTAFVLQLLGEQRRLNSPHGRAAFGTLLLQDLAVIPAIVVVNLAAPGTTSHGPSPWLLLATLVGLGAARFLLRPVLHFVAATAVHELFTAAALAIVVGAALALHSVGLSMGLGAFLAGMMVADSEYRHQLETDVAPFKGLLLGLFFMAVGMSVDLHRFASEPILVLGLTLALMTFKALLLFPIARWHGLDAVESARLSMVVSQGGEFAFVLLASALVAGLVSAAVADLAVLVVIASMALTPLGVWMLDRLLTGRKAERPYDRIEAEERPVIIAGFGRFGQIVARVLSMHRIPFTALEINPSQVEFVRSFGNEIYFGDATRLDLLQAARVADARAVVIAVDDADAALRIAALVRETCPRVAILARARNRTHEIQLREVGVQFSVRETLMSSLTLTGQLLEVLGHSGSSARQSIDLFREQDAATLARQRAVYHDETAFRQMTRDAAEELRQLFDEDAQRRDALRRELSSREAGDDDSG